jgi:hypothetical protein
VTLASQNYQHELWLSVALTAAAIVSAITGFALTRSFAFRGIYVLILVMSAAVLANALNRLATIHAG